MDNNYLMYPHLMSRADLLKILEERNLQISNLHDLDTNEIIKIYSKFALPLSKREQGHSSKSSENNSFNNKNHIETNQLYNCPKSRVSLKRNSSVLETNMDLPSNKISNSSLNIEEKISNLELQKKRLLINEDNDNNIESTLNKCQQKLKRQKITWP